MLKINLLQTPSVQLDGKTVTFPFKRADALLYYMVVRRSATRQELISLLWESCDETVGLKNLRNALYTLKKSLCGEFLISPQKSLVIVNPQWELDCDYDRFTRENDFSAYQGEFLQGFAVKNAFSFEEWLMRTREKLHDQYLKNLSQRAKAALDRADVEQAAELAAAYLREDPLDEPMSGFLMSCYRRMRQYARAAKVYQRLKEQLAEELGADPLESTAILYYEILNEWNDTARPDVEAKERAPVGREKAYAALRAAVLSFREGAVRRCSQLLTGEAGSGKSELINHFVQRADLSGCLVLRCACLMSEEGIPLAPWDSLALSLFEFVRREQIDLPAHVAARLGRMFPAFDVPASERVSRALRQADESLTGNMLMLVSAVARRKKILLILEDIQWMDRESLMLLDFLLRRFESGGLMAILSCRVECRPEIAAFQAKAITDGLLSQHKLATLTKEQTHELLLHELGEETASRLLEQFYQETRGNLQLLTELIRAFRQSGDTQEIVGTMSDILMDRLSGLPAEVNQVAELVSIFPEQAPYSALLMLMNQDDRKLAGGLKVLQARGLIEEAQNDTDPTYYFIHQRIRQLVYERLTYFQRKPLHQKAAEMLVGGQSAQSAEACRGIAQHFRLAGDRLCAAQYRIYALELESICSCEPFAAIAGPAAKRKSAVQLEQEAEQELLELSALRRERADSAVLARLEQMILLIRGRVALFAGNVSEGISLLGSLSGADANRDGSMMVKACYLLALYALYTQSAGLAENYIATGMRRLERNPDPLMLARFQRLRGSCLCLQAEYEKSTYYLVEAIDVLEKLPGDVGGAFPLAEAYADFGQVCSRQKNYAKAASYYKKALALVEKDTPPIGIAGVYVEYGRTAFALDDHVKARSLFCRGFEIAQQTGELWGAAAAAAFQAYYDVLDGAYEKSIAALEFAQEKSSRLNSPVERAILCFVQMSICTRLELENRTTDPLRKLLPQTAEYYARQGIRLLAGLPDVFEEELLVRELREGIVVKNHFKASELYSKHKHFMTE